MLIDAPRKCFDIDFISITAPHTYSRARSTPLGMNQGIQVKLNAPNWPAQVKAGMRGAADRQVLEQESINRKKASAVARMRWSENGSPTGTTFPAQSKRSICVMAASPVRPCTSGYLMRQCRVCKMLYEGYHGCSAQASAQLPIIPLLSPSSPPERSITSSSSSVKPDYAAEPDILSDATSVMTPPEADGPTTLASSSLRAHKRCRSNRDVAK